MIPGRHQPGHVPVVEPQVWSVALGLGFLFLVVRDLGIWDARLWVQTKARRFKIFCVVLGLGALDVADEDVTWREHIEYSGEVVLKTVVMMMMMMMVI